MRLGNGGAENCYPRRGVCRDPGKIEEAYRFGDRGLGVSIKRELLDFSSGWVNPRLLHRLVSLASSRAVYSCSWRGVPPYPMIFPPRGRELRMKEKPGV